MTVSNLYTFTRHSCKYFSHQKPCVRIWTKKRWYTTAIYCRLPKLSLSLFPNHIFSHKICDHWLHCCQINQNKTSVSVSVDSCKIFDEIENVSDYRNKQRKIIIIFAKKWSQLIVLNFAALLLYVSLLRTDRRTQYRRGDYLGHLSIDGFTVLQKTIYPESSHWWKDK